MSDKFCAVPFDPEAVSILWKMKQGCLLVWDDKNCYVDWILPSYISENLAQMMLDNKWIRECSPHQFEITSRGLKLVR